MAGIDPHVLARVLIMCLHWKVPSSSTLSSWEGLQCAAHRDGVPLRTSFLPRHYSSSAPYILPTTRGPSVSKATSQGPRSWCHSYQAREVPTQMWPQRDFNKDTWSPLPIPRPHPGQPAEVSGASAHQRDWLASFCSLLSSTNRCWAISEPGCLGRRGPSGGLSGRRTGLLSAVPDLPIATSVSRQLLWPHESPGSHTRGPSASGASGCSHSHSCFCPGAPGLYQPAQAA